MRIFKKHFFPVFSSLNTVSEYKKSDEISLLIDLFFFLFPSTLRRIFSAIPWNHVAWYFLNFPLHYLTTKQRNDGNTFFLWMKFTFILRARFRGFACDPNDESKDWARENKRQVLLKGLSYILEGRPSGSLHRELPAAQPQVPAGSSDFRSVPGKGLQLMLNCKSSPEFQPHFQLWLLQKRASEKHKIVSTHMKTHSTEKRENRCPETYLISILHSDKPINTAGGLQG